MVGVDNSLPQSGHLSTTDRAQGREVCRPKTDMPPLSHAANTSRKTEVAEVSAVYCHVTHKSAPPSSPLSLSLSLSAITNGAPSAATSNEANLIKRRHVRRVSRVSQSSWSDPPRMHRRPPMPPRLARPRLARHIRR